MGWWVSQHGILGDEPADILDSALRGIVDCYRREAKRLPTQGELANLVEFCTSGILRPACGNVAYSYTEAGDDDAPRAAERGFQGASGPASIASTEASGKMMANVNPVTGEHYAGRPVEEGVPSVPQKPDWDLQRDRPRVLEEAPDEDSGGEQLPDDSGEDVATESLLGQPERAEGGVEAGAGESGQSPP